MSLHFTCAAALRAAVAVLLRSPFRFPARLAQVGVSTALAVTLFCQEVHAAEPPAPTVTGVSPASGPTDGGTMVTLTGTDFTTAHAVFFGASAAGGWVVNSDTQITAYSPSGSAGVVSITVTTPSGTSATSAANQFTYVPAADLAMTLTDAPDPVQAGDNLTYTLTITNNGPDAAVEPAFSDVLPTALTFVSLTSPEGWNATTPAVGANGTINASAATLASGASAVFTLVVAVDTTTSDDTTLTNTATVSATTEDPTLANNSATATTSVTANADLAVTVTAASSGSVPAGEVATYNITVTNNGPQRASTVVVYAKLSGRVTFASAAPDADATDAGWTLFNSPGVGTQDNIFFVGPELASGASATVVLDGTIDPTAAQGAGAGVWVVTTSSVPDPDSSDNEFTLNLLVGPALDAATATALTNVGAGTRVSGNLYPAGHVDAYSFFAHAGDRVYAATATTSSSDATNASRDTVLHLARSDGLVLELDDDDGGLSSTSSSIAGLRIPADGTYYVTVECRRPEAVVFPYDLYVRVQSGSPETETDDSETGQALSTAGWVAGATSDGTEVDRYEITLAAGQTLFASLDLDPERDDTGWNAKLTLRPIGGDPTQSFEMNGSDNVSNTPPSSEAMMFTVKDAGEYALEISSADGSFGNYHLSATVLAAPVETTHTFTALNSDTGEIPDGGELTSTLTIPTSLPIGRLKVALQITHDNLSALDLHLTSPSGNTVGLLRDVGGNGNVLDVILDDTAAYALGFDQIDPDTTLLTTRGAVFKPGRNYRLGWFAGQDAQGVWTLTVRDRGADSVTGVLEGWSLIVVDQDPALTGVRTVHLNADFEANDGGFTSSGTADTWAHGAPAAAPIASAHSGTKAWKTNFAGDYATGSSQDLVSPEVDLTEVSLGNSIELSWAMSYQLADASKVNAYIAVEEVGGDDRRQEVWRWLGPTMRDDGVGAGALTIAEAAGWGMHRVLISDFAGKTIRLRVHLESDDAEALAGLAIDDVSVSSYRARSTDATLSNLVLSTGTLSPTFASGTTSYAASVGNAVSSIRVTPTASDVHATLQVNGATVISGNPSNSLALNVGSNSLSVDVTAEDGATTRTYSVSVTRAAPSGGGSSPTPPVITQQPQDVVTEPGKGASFVVRASGSGLRYQWQRNGIDLSGATGGTLALTNVQPADVGYYSVIVSNTAGAVASRSALLQLTFSEQKTGSSEQVGADIQHPNGHIYDQFLMTGISTSVKAQPGKIVRTSFIDLDDDIVQVEFSGAGTLTIRLEAGSDPAAPVNYVQPGVNYVKGHATIEITEADESSYLTIFSVGKITALNQTLFRDAATYDGVADVALVTIHSRNGKFAELRTGNAHYFAGSGLTGVYAPGVAFNKVFIGDVTGDDDAIAVILTGAVADARITGGSLEQLNGGSVEVGEIDRLQFTDGMTSHGATLPAQSNRGKLVRGGVDVTAELVR